MKLTNHILDNGIEAMFCQMPTKSSAAVFTVLAGYGKEKDNEHGMAHLIEHMSFKGIRGMDSDRIMRELALCGAEWNASTSPHFVNYYLHCPSANMPKAIGILANVFLSPVMSDQDLAKEKKVVASETADYHDEASSWFQERVVAHHLDTAIGHSCFGKKSIVKKFSIDDLARFRKEHYRSSNTMLSVCGGFDKEAVKNVLDKIAVPNGWNLGKREYVNCERWKKGSKQEYHIYREGVSQANIVALIPAPSLVSENSQAYRVMLSILGGGTFSVLNKRIREDLAMCYNVSADEEVFLGNSNFSVGSVEMSCSGDNLKKATEEITVCTEMVASGNFDEELVECAKQSKLGTLCDASDSPLGTAFLNSTRAIFGDPNPDISVLSDSYKSITKEDVVEVAKEFLKQDGFRWSYMVPSQKK